MLVDEISLGGAFRQKVETELPKLCIDDNPVADLVQLSAVARLLRKKSSGARTPIGISVALPRPSDSLYPRRALAVSRANEAARSVPVREANVLKGKANDDGTACLHGARPAIGGQ